MSGKIPVGNKNKETEKLKQNVQDQLARLLQQLTDLKEEKDSFSPDEYAEMEKDTLDQLRDFQDSLKKMTEGDLSLADELSAVKLVRSTTFKKVHSHALYAYNTMSNHLLSLLWYTTGPTSCSLPGFLHSRGTETLRKEAANSIARKTRRTEGMHPYSP